MFSDTYRAGLILFFSSFALAGCGGGSSPAQPAPLPSATPTPAPTPPPKPLSVIPPCPLPAIHPPTNPSCPTVAPPGSGGAGSSAYGADVNAAIDRVIAVRPDLFDLNDVLGGPRVKDYDGYMTAVVAALGEAGLCGHAEAEGELGVKRSNDWGENWSIWYSLGYTRRKFLYGCSPPLF